MKYEPGEVVEVRRLPGQKWEERVERATYVRRVGREEMPFFWRGPLGHVVRLSDGRQTTLSSVRIRKPPSKATP